VWEGAEEGSAEEARGWWGSEDTKSVRRPTVTVRMVGAISVRGMIGLGGDWGGGRVGLGGGGVGMGGVAGQGGRGGGMEGGRMLGEGAQKVQAEWGVVRRSVGTG